MSDDIVALLRNALKASEDLVQAQAAHIRKLELELELFRAAYQAAAKRSQKLDMLPEKSFLDEIQDRARCSKPD